MFGNGSLDAGTLLGVGIVLLAIGVGYRLAAAGGVDAFPVPLLIGLMVAALGPLDGLHPGLTTTRAGAEIAVVVLLFSLGLDFTASDRTAATRAVPAARLLAVDAALNFVPGALFGLLAGFGLTGAVLLGGVTWASSWAMASGLLDREGWYGNREAPAVLSVLVSEHAAVAFFLPVAAALVAPGDTVSRITALLGSAAAVAFAAWLVLGPAPLLHTSLLAGLAPGPGLGLPLLLVGTVLVLAGVASAIGVATAGVAYLAGIVLGAPGPAGGSVDVLRTVGRTVDHLRELSAAAAGLALGLLIPASELPGAIAGGAVLAALTGGTKVLTGWWAVRRLRSSGPVPAPVGRAGGLRAGLTLVPRGELAVALGILAVLSAPARGPGSALAALAAIEVVLTAATPALVRLRRRPGWYRWAGPTPAAVRPEPSGAG